MNKNYIEIGAIAFVIVFSLSLFTIVPRQYPHNISYTLALEAEKTVAGGGGPFDQLTHYFYFALGGTKTLDRGIFNLAVMYIPPALGVLSAVALYLAVRTRLGPGMGALGAVLLAASPSFLLNALAGVYAPEMMSLAIFCSSLALFSSGDVMKNRILGGAAALFAGVLLGWNTTVSEAGIILAGAMVASAAVQFFYYVKEKEYGNYGVRLAALITPALLFLPSAKFASLGDRLSLDGAFASYSLLLPPIALFAFVAIRDLVQDKKRYELFFLALAISSAGIALFDPVAAAPGMAVGAVFGIAASGEHLKEKMTSIGFVALAGAFAVFSFIKNFTTFESGIALSLLVGGMAAVIMLLYEGEKQLKSAVFAGITLLVGTTLLSGIVGAQREYSTIGPGFGDALNWTKNGLPESAVIGAIGPKDSVEFLSGRKGCCNAEVARYLLGNGGTEELKRAGAEYMIVDKGYFDDLKALASVGNVSRPTVEVYLFNGYLKDDRQNYFAYLLSQSGDAMKVPVDINAFPLKEDVQVDSVGQVPYGKIKRFEPDDLPIGPGSRIALPLYGERNNLFDIYFQTPDGLELSYSAIGGAIRVYRVT